MLEARPTTLCAVDVYSSVFGPCDALDKKITSMYGGDEDITFIQAQADSIELLAEYVNKRWRCREGVRGGGARARVGVCGSDCECALPSTPQLTFQIALTRLVNTWWQQATLPVLQRG